MAQNIHARWGKFRSRFNGSPEAAFAAFEATDTRLLNGENTCSDCSKSVLWLTADHQIEGNRNKRCRQCQRAFERPPEPVRALVVVEPETQLDRIESMLVKLTKEFLS